MRRSAAMGMLVLLVACSGGATDQGATSTTSRTASLPTTTTAAITTTATTGAPTSSTTSSTTAATTTSPPTPPTLHAVVAEEDARRLAVFAADDPCLASTGECPPEPWARFELPHRPHNLASIGSVVYASHPTAGSISRVDVATREISTMPIGIEPHDIAPTWDGLLAVTDESANRVLLVDPVSLAELGSIDLPGPPHDLVVDGGVLWVTVIGTDALARVEGGEVEMIETGGAPHDLVVTGDGTIWFSNWNSDRLDVFDPSSRQATEAPAGVHEPHHFAIDSDGAIWVSDNGGSSVVGFTGGDPVSVEVGPVPHHLSFLGDVLVVAVSGSGEAVFVRDGLVVARASLTRGLHGVTVVATPP